MSEQGLGLSDGIPNPEKLPNIIKDDRLYPYVDKEEAVFLLGIIRNYDCSCCPCLAKGCRGSYSRQELAVINYQDFLHTQVRGTEGHLCMKLRNVVNMGDTEMREFNHQFGEYFRRKVGIIVKNPQNTLVTDNEVENRSVQMEQNFNQKLSAVNTNAQGQINNLTKKCEIIENQARQMEARLLEFQNQNNQLVVQNNQLAVQNERLNSEKQTLIAEVGRLKGN